MTSRFTRKNVSATALAACLVLSACGEGESADSSTQNGGPGETTEEAVPAVRVAALSEDVVFSGANPAERSGALTAAMYTEAPFVILSAPAAKAQAQAASLALAWRAPGLGGGDDAALVEELARLKSTDVMLVGADVPAGVEVTVHDVPAVSEELSSHMGVRFSAAQAPDIDPSLTEAEQAVLWSAAVADLEPGQIFEGGEPAPSETSGETDAETAGETATPIDTLPKPYPEQADEGVVAVTDGADPALVGSLRVAGASVVVVDNNDPRGSSDAIDAVSQADVVVGVVAGDADQFAANLAVAKTGVELPGGGQLLFDDKHYIALYGSPVTSSLGVLGEQGTEETVARAAELAAQYQALTDATVVPTLEIIVTVAAGQPGDDGNYSNEFSHDTFLPLIEAAGDAGQYVVLDFQPGRSDFLSQIMLYEDLLAYPHVGIALDPEWRLEPDEMPLTRIGHVEAAEVNDVINYVADYTAEHDLPQKMVVLHQFQLQMLRERDQIDLSRPEVAVLIHADGQGPQGAKQETWRVLHEGAPDVAWGWKNFYDEDVPMLTPEETFAVEPRPEFISYQ